MEMMVIKCHLAADSPAPKAPLPPFLRRTERKSPSLISFLFIYFVCFGASAFVSVVICSAERSADGGVSLSSVAPSDRLTPPSERTHFFFF